MAIEVASLIKLDKRLKFLLSEYLNKNEEFLKLGGNAVVCVIDEELPVYSFVYLNNKQYIDFNCVFFDRVGAYILRRDGCHLKGDDLKIARIIGAAYCTAKKNYKLLLPHFIEIIYSRNS